MPISKNGTKQQCETIDDDYDHCKELAADDSKSSSRYLLRNKSNLSEQDKKISGKFTRQPSSPMKRSMNNESVSNESPKKRIKIPDLVSSVVIATTTTTTTTNAETNAVTVPIKAFNLMNRLHENGGVDRCSSPTRANQRLAADQTKKFASTPKADRKSNISRVQELSEQNSASIERNLSSNWADIIEDLEEQTKELNEYVEKVSAKYSIDKDKLLKSLESDAETLRKRQKRINFGKVTPEYQRYILAISRKKREVYHPKTPNKYRKCSRRKFDGQIKKWRKLLHVWDENPDLLPEYKNSIENDDGENDADMTEDFGGASNITASNFSYNVDDYDIIDDEMPVAAASPTSTTTTAAATAAAN